MLVFTPRNQQHETAVTIAPYSCDCDHFLEKQGVARFHVLAHAHVQTHAVPCMLALLAIWRRLVAEAFLV